MGRRAPCRSLEHRSRTDSPHARSRAANTALTAAPVTSPGPPSVFGDNSDYLLQSPGSRRRAGVWRWLAGILLAAALVYALIEPSNARDWSPDQQVMPVATFRERYVDVRHIRNTEYRSTDDYTVSHYDRTFDLDALRSVWFVVEPFHGMEGPAHTLVSFGFANDVYVAISVEIRKEKGERFSPLLGLLKRYELMYVVADERDVIKLRSNYRKDDVFLYPIRTTPERRRRMFVEMLQRANRLAEHPEFYNTLTNTCTTNIVRHVNTIAAGRVPWSYKVLLPAYSDELAYDLGLIDTTLPLDEARRRFRINDRAARYADDPEFSRRIREMD
jgi:hypothetical protein